MRVVFFQRAGNLSVRNSYVSKWGKGYISPDVHTVSTSDSSVLLQVRLRMAD